MLDSDISAGVVFVLIATLILNIIVLVYFFGLCGNVKAIRKNLCEPKTDRDFYNIFLKFISQGEHEKAVEVIREYFWAHTSGYQTSLSRTRRMKMKDPDREKKVWEEYIAPYKNLFELVGEKPPALLSASIVQKVADSIRKVNEREIRE